MEMSLPPRWAVGTRFPGKTLSWNHLAGCSTYAWMKMHSRRPVPARQSTDSSRDTESLTSEIGMRVTRVYKKAAGRLTTDASVAWLHDFDIDDRTITTSYTGAPACPYQ
jgi:hypothetical protein